MCNPATVKLKTGSTWPLSTTRPAAIQSPDAVRNRSPARIQQPRSNRGHERRKDASPSLRITWPSTSTSTSFRGSWWYTSTTSPSEMVPSGFSWNAAQPLSPRMDRLNALGSAVSQQNRRSRRGAPLDNSVCRDLGRRRSGHPLQLLSAQGPANHPTNMAPAARPGRPTHRPC